MDTSSTVTNGDGPARDTTASRSLLLTALAIDEGVRHQRNKAAPIAATAGCVLAVAAAIGAGQNWFTTDTAADARPAARVERPVATAEAVRSGAILEATGYVTARRKATVSTQVIGRIQEIRVEEGDFVEQGQMLALLDGAHAQAELMLGRSRVAAAESQLLELTVEIRQAELDQARVERLTERGSASQVELDQKRFAADMLKARMQHFQRETDVTRGELKVREQALADTQIRAPFSGVVIDKTAHPGETISPTSNGGSITRSGICTLVDMSSLEVEVDVSENMINRVFPGQKSVARLNSHPDWEIPAQVVTVIPTADRNKASVRVRLKFLAQDARILPDMGVTVSFFDEAHPSVSQATQRKAGAHE